MKKYKKELKGFVLGFLIAGLLLFNISTFADSITQSINVVFSKIKVSINGKDIKMDTEPLIYNNRTYVPIRFVADNLGMVVKWNETTNTVELTNNSLNIAQNINYQVINYSDGSQYIGEIKDGLREGFGTFFYSPNDSKERLRYDGEWKNDKRNGYGTLVWVNGNKISSLKWENDELNDFITYKTDNEFYTGQVIKGVYNGLGVFINSKGKAAGEWNNGVMHGYNIVTMNEYSIKSVFLLNMGNIIKDLTYSSNTNTNVTPQIPSSTSNSNINEYLDIKKAQYEKELADLQQQIENVKNEKNVKILNGTEWIWTYDQNKVDKLQKQYDAKLSNFNAWKALNGIK
jgi:hypothetical protein